MNLKSAIKYLLTLSAILLTNITLASNWSNKVNIHEIASNVIFVKAARVKHTSSKNHAADVLLEIENTGQMPHGIIASFSPTAAQIQLLQASGEHHGHIQRINEITIDPKTTKNLQTDGMHIMLIGLKKTLDANKKIPLALIFHDGSWSTLLVNIT